MTDEGWFSCPACGKRYHWFAAQAGKRVRCHCGAALRIPLIANKPAQLLEPSPGSPKSTTSHHQTTTSHIPEAKPTEHSDEPGDVYSLSLETQHDDTSDAHDKVSSGTGRKRCPNCGQLISSHAVICIHCGQGATAAHNAAAKFDTGTGAIAALIDLPDATNQDKLSPSAQSAKVLLEKVRSRFEYDSKVKEEVVKKARFRDVTLPLILFISGFLMLVLTTVCYQPVYGKVVVPMWGNALYYSVGVVVNFVFLFFGILLVAKLLDEEVGTLMVTAWKLLSLAVFCVAADAMLYWGLDVITQGFAMAGGFVRLAFDAAVFFCCAGVLLQMEFLELMVLFLCARVLPMIVLVLVAMIVYSMFT